MQGTFIVAGQSNALRIWDSSPEAPAGQHLLNVSFGGTSLALHWQPNNALRLREALIAAVRNAVGNVTILWNQGEGDTDLTNYYANFAQLKSDVEGSRTDVVWLIFFRSNNATGTGGISTMQGIQQNICDNLARCRPIYTNAYVFESDNVHYTADTQRRAWRDALLVAQTYWGVTYYRSSVTYATQLIRDDQQAAIFKKYRTDILAARDKTDLDEILSGGYAAPQVTDRYGAGVGLSLLVDEAMVGMHGQVVNIGAHGDITIATRYPLITDSETIFGAKVADFWLGDQGVKIVGGEVDVWYGQKLNAGVALAAPTSSNRCTQTAEHANFNNRATINASDAGNNYLRATGIAPALAPSGGKMCMLSVCRSSAGFGAAHFETFVSVESAADTFLLWTGLVGSAGNMRAYSTAANNINHAVTETNAMLVQAQSQNGSGNLKLKIAGSTVTGFGNANAAAVTAIGFGAHSNGSDRGNIECAALTLLNDTPTVGEVTAFEAYVLDRFGVAA